MKALLLKAWGYLSPWLQKVLAEANGAPSSVRIVMFAWNALVALFWSILCIWHRTLVPIDHSVLELLAIANGAKVVQKWGEDPAPPCDK